MPAESANSFQSLPFPPNPSSRWGWPLSNQLPKYSHIGPDRPSSTQYPPGYSPWNQPLVQREYIAGQQALAPLEQSIGVALPLRKPHGASKAAGLTAEEVILRRRYKGDTDCDPFMKDLFSAKCISGTGSSASSTASQPPWTKDEPATDRTTSKAPSTMTLDSMFVSVGAGRSSYSFGDQSSTGAQL